MAFTFFFRDLHTLEHAVNHLIPEVTGRSRIRIWDAGCAMGPEPYTLAILLAENMGQFSFKNVMIHATDIDDQDTFGKIIKEGIYSDEEVKRIPPEIFKKYFEPVSFRPGYFKLIELIRSKLQFEKNDLLKLQPPGDGYSLIVCKNVLLHFQYQERIEVIKMFHRVLTPGGFFITEQTQKMPDEIKGLFKQVVPDAQLFRKL